MSTFTVVNTTASPAMLVIQRGAPGDRNPLFGRVAVAANGGRAVVPTSNAFTASASITLEDGNTYRAGPVRLSDGSQALTAQMLVMGGTFDFQLAASPGTAPNQITLLNTCRQPVTFELSATSPMSNPSIVNTAVVVASRATAAVNTEPSYSFRGIINGVTTAPVATTPDQVGRDLTVTIFQDDIQVGDWPSYAVRLE